MFSKLNQTRLSVRVMLALLLLATLAFLGMAWELSGLPSLSWTTGFPSPVRDMAFLAALFNACGLVGWMYASDLEVTLVRGYGVFSMGREWPACED